MSKELISVIIPVYNVEEYLSRCIDSILTQTYQNLEIILVDDGSTDDSYNICEEYSVKDKRVKVIHQNNEGVSVARNVGLDNAKGEYISFIDSDDWIEPNLYEYAVKCLQKKKADIVKYHYLVEDNGVSKNTGCNYDYTGFVKKNEVIDLLLAAKIQGECWSYVFKKDLVSSGLCFMKDIIYGEDLLFSTELFMKAKNIYFINDKLHHYFQNNTNSVTKDANRAIEIIKVQEKIYNAMISIFKKYGKYEDRIKANISTNLFLKICFHINKVYKLNKQNEINDYLLSNNGIYEIAKNVDVNKIKTTYKVFRFLIIHHLKFGLRLYGVLKHKMMSSNN